MDGDRERIVQTNPPYRTRRIVPSISLVRMAAGTERGRRGPRRQTIGRTRNDCVDVFRGIFRYGLLPRLRKIVRPISAKFGRSLTNRCSNCPSYSRQWRRVVPARFYGWRTGNVNFDTLAFADYSRFSRNVSNGLVRGWTGVFKNRNTNAVVPNRRSNVCRSAVFRPVTNGSQ